MLPKWDQDEAHKKTYGWELLEPAGRKEAYGQTLGAVWRCPKSGEGESVQRASGGSTEEVSEVGLRRRGGAMRKPWQQSLQTLEWAQTGLQRERRERALAA